MPDKENADFAKPEPPRDNPEEPWKNWPWKNWPQWFEELAAENELLRFHHAVACGVIAGLAFALGLALLARVRV